MRLVVLLLTLSLHLAGQTPGKIQIQQYAKKVDSLRAAKKLKKYFYPQMSYCGGALYGYYWDGKLVFMDAVHGGEFGNFTSHKIYVRDSAFCKIAYEEHWAEEEKYHKKFPNDKEINEKKLTYSDTLYTILFSSEPSYIKSSRGKVISKEADMGQVSRLLVCANRMRRELESEKKEQ